MNKFLNPYTQPANYQTQDSGKIAAQVYRNAQSLRLSMVGRTWKTQNMETSNQKKTALLGNPYADKNLERRQKNVQPMKDAFGENTDVDTIALEYNALKVSVY